MQTASHLMLSVNAQPLFLSNIMNKREQNKWETKSLMFQSVVLWSVRCVCVGQRAGDWSAFCMYEDGPYLIRVSSVSPRAWWGNSSSYLHHLHLCTIKGFRIKGIGSKPHWMSSAHRSLVCCILSSFAIYISIKGIDHQKKTFQTFMT